jgi:hypothetical protein
VARPCGVDHCLRKSLSRYASADRHYSDDAVVLPFTNRTNDPSQGYFADGDTMLDCHDTTITTVNDPSIDTTSTGIAMTDYDS